MAKSRVRIPGLSRISRFQGEPSSGLISPALSLGMRFARCVYTKVESVEFSSRKVAAVNRRLQRNRDAVALLPDLVAKVPTPEQDMAATVSGTARSNKEWRDLRAAQWRRARRALDAMEGNRRRGVIRYWNEWVERGHPGDPGYLLTHILAAERGESFWGRMRQLRQLSLIAQGRLPKALFFTW